MKAAPQCGCHFKCRLFFVAEPFVRVRSERPSQKESALQKEEEEQRRMNVCQPSDLLPSLNPAQSLFIPLTVYICSDIKGKHVPVLCTEKKCKGTQLEKTSYSYNRAQYSGFYASAFPPHPLACIMTEDSVNIIIFPINSKEGLEMRKFITEM